MRAGSGTSIGSLGSAASRLREREAVAGREQAHRQLGEHDAQALDLRQLEELAHGDPELMADVKNRAASRLLRLGDYQAAVAATSGRRCRGMRDASAAAASRVTRVCRRIPNVQRCEMSGVLPFYTLTLRETLRCRRRATEGRMRGAGPL